MLEHPKTIHSVKKDILLDAIVIIVFGIISILVYKDLVSVDLATWDLIIPSHDVLKNLNRAFVPINPFGAGGSWLDSTYPTIIESMLTSIFGNLAAAKIMTFIPIPLSFATLFLSARSLHFGRIKSIAGGIFFAISPASLALAFSWGQQWFYALLPFVLVLTYSFAREITLQKFPWRKAALLSILYAFSLSFMMQGLLLLIPLALIIIIWVFAKKENYNWSFFLRFMRATLIVSCLVFVLLLPYSMMFLLPSFSFFSSGDFAIDKYSLSPSVFYSDISVDNVIRLAGITGYHLQQLGFNDLNIPSNIVGLIYSAAIIALPSLFLNKLRASSVGLRFPLLVLSVLASSIILLELGRSGLLWHLPLSTILRNPIKLMMLVALALSFLVIFSLSVLEVIIKKRGIQIASIFCVLLVVSILIYNYPFLGGTFWIKPETDYWAKQGHPVDWKDVLVTPAMKKSVDFAQGQLYKDDGQFYRYFIFPLMPAQKLFFQNNLPLISAGLPSATNSMVRENEYMNIVNRMMLDGEKDAAYFLAPVSGKYVVIVNDLSSTAFTGKPRTWGGVPGALTGNPEEFKEIIMDSDAFVKLPGDNSVFVNNYAIPPISYVNNAVLIDGNISTLEKIYEFITPKNYTSLPIVLFSETLQNDTIKSLIESNAISAYIHNDTSVKSTALPDIYFLQVDKLDKVKSLFSDNEITSLPIYLPSKENGVIPIFTYDLHQPIDMRSIHKISISLRSSLENLVYALSFFNEDGQQIVFDIPVHESGQFKDYGMTPNEGKMFAKDGSSPIDTMDLTHIKRVEVRAKIPSNTQITSSAKVDIKDIRLTGYFSSGGSMGIDLPLNLDKAYHSLWIKASQELPANPRIVMGSTIISANRLNGTTYRLDFTSPKNSDVVLEIPGSGKTVKDLMIVSSNNAIGNLDDLLTSSIHKVKYQKLSDTNYDIQFNDSKPKILLFTMLYDKNWSINESTHIPIYGFLNGFLLEKQTHVLLKYSVQDILNPLIVILAVTWMIIFIVVLKDRLRT